MLQTNSTLFEPDNRFTNELLIINKSLARLFETCLQLKKKSIPAVFHSDILPLSISEKLKSFE